MTFSSNTAIITVKNVDYHRIIHNNSKSEAIKLLQNFYSRRLWVFIKKYSLNF